MPVDTTTSALLKITFENNTSGANLELCAGTDAMFAAGTVGLRLSDSGGPGFRFLTIIDAQKLSNQVIYVLRAVGTANSNFTINIE